MKRLLPLCCLLPLVAGCSWVRGMAVKSVAGTLAEGGTTITSHNDPELIGDALPFALTLYESLLESVPKHEPLLTATCSAYTQYAFGFLAVEAERVQFDDFDRSKHLTTRALTLALRGRDYCWRGLEVRFEGITARLKDDPAAAVARARDEHVPLLYWSAASLGSAISLGGLDRPDLLVDWRVVRALAERALALDETWNYGSIHELMLTVESQGEALGGSEDRARRHFARAVEIQKGLAPGPYVSLAMGIAKGKQDRPEFERLLKAALAIDPEKNPDQRLITLIMQNRARFLLANVDQFILSDEARPRTSSKKRSVRRD